MDALGTLASQPASVWLLWLSAALIGAVINLGMRCVELTREVARLQARLAEARTARLDMLVHLDRASGAAAVAGRQRDAMAEAAAGVAMLGRLDALHSPGPPGPVAGLQPDSLGD